MCVGLPGRRSAAADDLSFVSFLCTKKKKRKELKDIFYWFEERRNVYPALYRTTDKEGGLKVSSCRD
jgi:hypothetical protein